MQYLDKCLNNVDSKVFIEFVTILLLVLWPGGMWDPDQGSSLYFLYWKVKS